MATLYASKFDTLRREMDAYTQNIRGTMFEYYRKIIAVNCMMDRVNCYSDQLYYRNPSDFLGWSQNDLSPYAKPGHAYPLHEYTIYVCRESF